MPEPGLKLRVGLSVHDGGSVELMQTKPVLGPNAGRLWKRRAADVSSGTSDIRQVSHRLQGDYRMRKRVLATGRSPRRALAQSRGDRRKGGDVDAVLARFGNQRQRVGTLAHAGQGPQQCRARAAAAVRYHRPRRIL